ncbi:MAG: transcriptional repressor [Chloroflexi bacterium]|nr:MAG: transcriptional repressor [Chloroflexota bacterium]TME99655.1 MAG: transcriptional repressor [Chloroflexota bacterium]TMG29407.1 MAG: transcriptional repressor [Chloroflexota bacterium]
MTRTRCPALRSATTRSRPRAPVPPVTSTFMADQLSATGRQATWRNASRLQNCYSFRQMARPSHVRDSVRHVLDEGERHDWSIEDLHAAILASGRSADFSSVFRAVVRLERDGAIRRVNLGDGRLRFEASGHHHDHIRCESCGAVASLPECVLQRAESRVERGTGFAITGHRLTFSGLCPSCR